MVYLVKYELNRPGQNYPGLWAALGQYDYIRDNGLHSAWFLSTSWSAQQVYNHLAPHIDRSDRIFITRIRPGEHFGWMDQAIWNWITARAS